MASKDFKTSSHITQGYFSMNILSQYQNDFLIEYDMLSTKCFVELFSSVEDIQPCWPPSITCINHIFLWFDF